MKLANIPRHLMALAMIFGACGSDQKKVITEAHETQTAQANDYRETDPNTQAYVNEERAQMAQEEATQQARRDAANQAQEKIASLDSKASELYEQSGALRGTARVNFEKVWTQYAAQRTLANEKTGDLWNVPQAHLDTAKVDVDKSIDVLEQSVERLKQVVERQPHAQ